MYNDTDLGTLMDALNTLTTSGFLEYDINVGQKINYLSITVSNAQVANFPGLSLLPQGQKLIQLYYTTDFTPPVATFISNFQSGVQATVTGNAALMTAISAQMANWSTFASTYNSFGT